MIGPPFTLLLDYRLCCPVGVPGLVAICSVLVTRVYAVAVWMCRSDYVTLDVLVIRFPLISIGIPRSVNVNWWEVVLLVFWNGYFQSTI